MNPTLLKHYIHRYYRPDRITIAGVNVDHDELVKYCNKYLVDNQPSWLSDDVVEPDQSLAQYTGGIIKVRFHVTYLVINQLLRFELHLMVR